MADINDSVINTVKCRKCGAMPAVIWRASTNQYRLKCKCCGNEAIPCATRDEAINAWNSENEIRQWLHDDDSNSWECPQCHATYAIDNGSPKTMHMNFCCICGARLELPK